MILTLAGVIASCGNGGPATAAGVPAAEQVKQCIIEGGGQGWSQAPLKPEGFPSHVEVVKTIGPKLAHITLYISKRPAFNRRIAAEIEDFGEYQATVLYGGRGLVLLDFDISKPDEELARECLEG